MTLIVLTGKVCFYSRIGVLVTLCVPHEFAWLQWGYWSLCPLALIRLSCIVADPHIVHSAHGRRKFSVLTLNLSVPSDYLQICSPT